MLDQVLWKDFIRTARDDSRAKISYKRYVTGLDYG